MIRSLAAPPHRGVHGLSTDGMQGHSLRQQDTMLLLPAFPLPTALHCHGETIPAFLQPRLDFPSLCQTNVERQTRLQMYVRGSYTSSEMPITATHMRPCLLRDASQKSTIRASLLRLGLFVYRQQKGWISNVAWSPVLLNSSQLCIPQLYCTKRPLSLPRSCQRRRTPSCPESC